MERRSVVNACSGGLAALLGGVVMLGVAGCSAGHQASAPSAVERTRSFCSTFTESEGAYLGFVGRLAQPGGSLSLEQAVEERDAFRGTATTLASTAPGELTAEVDAYLTPWLALNTGLSLPQPTVALHQDAAAAQDAAINIEQHCSAAR
ncbi:MAG TPA: hypothetical protein VK139_04885 [Microbacteriaceae bacterium]|nr:hypothetical protein [Microbacteriaceae bacterium]